MDLRVSGQLAWLASVNICNRGFPVIPLSTSGVLRVFLHHRIICLAKARCLAPCLLGNLLKRFKPPLSLGFEPSTRKLKIRLRFPYRIFPLLFPLRGFEGNRPLLAKAK